MRLVFDLIVQTAQVEAAWKVEADRRSLVASGNSRNEYQNEYSKFLPWAL